MLLWSNKDKGRKHTSHNVHHIWQRGLIELSHHRILTTDSTVGTALIAISCSQRGKEWNLRTCRENYMYMYIDCIHFLSITSFFRGWKFTTNSESNLLAVAQQLHQATLDLRQLLLPLPKDKVVVSVVRIFITPVYLKVNTVYKPIFWGSS